MMRACMGACRGGGGVTRLVMGKKPIVHHGKAKMWAQRHVIGRVGAHESQGL